MGLQQHTGGKCSSNENKKESTEFPPLKTIWRNVNKINKTRLHKSETVRLFLALGPVTGGNLEGFLVVLDTFKYMN